MKSLSYLEIDKIVDDLQDLKGGVLQNIFNLERGLCFEFYLSKSYFVAIDLKPQCPAMIHLESSHEFKGVKSKSPSFLFLKKRGLGKRLLDIHRDEDFGRIVRMEFEGELSLEIRLFPHGQNLIATQGKNKISWHKPKDLQPLDTEMAKEGPPPPRNLDEIKNEWLGLQRSKKPVQNKWDEEKERGKLEKQLKVRLKKIYSEIESKESSIAKKKEETNSESDPRLRSELFETIKKEEKKLARVLERKAELKESLSEKGLVNELQKIKSKQSAQPSNPKVLEIAQKIKRMPLEKGAFASVGKSAKENVDLLKRAKAWDIWFHLRDFPGAYGFIHRNKNQEIDEKTLYEVAQWVARMSLKDKSANEGKVDVVYCEVRYLKLIRGDRLGRVQFRNETTLTIDLRKK